MFAKKSFIEENTLLDVCDEELAEFSGGDGLLSGLLGTVGQSAPILQPLTNPVTSLLGNTNISTDTTVQTPIANLGLKIPQNGALGGLL